MDEFEKEQLTALLSHDLLSTAEIYDLIEKAQAGDNKARNKVILQNQRLIVSIAQKYQKRGLSLSELLQEGQFGLIRAIEKFDLSKGYEFSTYASHWVRQAVSRAVEDKSCLIYKPNYLHLFYRQICNARQAIALETGDEATDEQIAGRLGEPVEKIVKVQEQFVSPVRLDKAVNDEEDTVFGDFIPDERQVAAQDIAEENQLAEMIENIIEPLVSRERTIIEMRFGLNGYGGQSYTLQEIAERFGLTRERIRQIEARALKRLRHPKNARKLREFYE